VSSAAEDCAPAEASVGFTRPYRVIEGGLMGFSVKGDYFEACTCDVSCPCIWGRPATKDRCDLFLAWHVTEGEKDGVDLTGMNVAMTVASPKPAAISLRSPR
jgi:hypothetical protein